MKDILRGIVGTTPNMLLKWCLAREYLQARILQALQDEGMFRHWAFVGGTALRFLYAIPRFSEDLDFSLVEVGGASFLDQALERIETNLRRETYAVGLKPKDDKTVVSALVKFRGLPYEIGLSPHEGEVLAIKIEVDTRPPSGAVLESSMARRHLTLRLTHYNKASLLSGKLHAVLSRTYTKGRDIYDLIWYLASRSWPEPNLPLLQSALSQTGWNGPEVNAGNWKSLVAARMESVNWDAAREDVRPFLEHAPEANLITRENVLSLLKP